MKHPRLVALAITVSIACASFAHAGAAAKGAKPAASADCCAGKTAAASAACPATMSCPAGSAQCTAAQKAACEKAMKAKGAANMSSCPMHGTSATAASANGCAAMGGKTATAANGCAAMGKTASAATCAMHGNSAAAMHGCAVCSDEATCDDDVRALNARAQVVPLRNGAMIVYTADTPENVRALQAALARHNETVLAALATNSEASLCGGCKLFRGAMASGKFSRELVNVKTGAQVLLTSSDHAIIQRIHDMAVNQAARTKS